MVLQARIVSMHTLSLTEPSDDFERILPTCPATRAKGGQRELLTNDAPHESR